MQKRSFIRRVAAIVLGCALSTCVSAADPGQSLPDGVEAHISIAAPRRFLDDAFQYVGAATKDTASHIPAEFLSMLASAYIPIPFSAWDPDSEFHAVFLPGAGPAYSLVAVFAHNSFESLLSGLEEAQWRVGEAEENEFFDETRPVILPNGRAMVLADLGEGWAVLAESADEAAYVAANPDWELDHSAGADLVARVRVGRDATGISEQLSEMALSRADDIVEAVSAAGLTEKAGAWMASLAEKYGRVFGEELEAAEEVRFDVGFADARLVLGVSALFGDGSWTRKWAETMESADDFPEGALLERLPGGFVTCGVGAPVTDVVPDIEAISETLFSELSELAPDRKAALLDYNKAVFAANPGESATAGYFHDGAPYQITIAAFDDVDAVIAAALKIDEALADIVERSFADPEESVRPSWEKQTDGEREWYCWTFEPANADRFRAFLERINAMDPNGGLNFEYNPDFRIYLAKIANPSALVTLAGPVSRDEFAAILKSVASPSAGAVSPLDTPNGREAIDSLGAAQLSLGLLNPDGMFLLYSLQETAAARRAVLSGDQSEKGANAASRLVETRRDVIARIAAEAGATDADAAFGIGAEDGYVVFRVAVPAASVRAVILKHERFSRLFREAVRKQLPSPGGIPDAGAPEGDDSGEPEAEEEAPDAA